MLSELITKLAHTIFDGRYAAFEIASTIEDALEDMTNPNVARCYSSYTLEVIAITLIWMNRPRPNRSIEEELAPLYITITKLEDILDLANRITFYYNMPGSYIIPSRSCDDVRRGILPPDDLRRGILSPRDNDSSDSDSD